VYLIHDSDMKLAEYMDLHNLSDEAVAEKVNRDRSNVLRWRKGVTKPDFDALVKLEIMTKGRVTATDFVKAAE